MFAHTTCFLTADNHWARIEELAEHPYIPVIGWSKGKFRWTRQPYQVKSVGEMLMYRISTVYQIDIVLTGRHKIHTVRGLVSVKALTPQDEMYMYLEGKRILTRPRSRISVGQTEAYSLRVGNHMQAFVVKDVNSRWKNAFATGLLICDVYGSSLGARSVIPRFLS